MLLNRPIVLIILILITTTFLVNGQSRRRSTTTSQAKIEDLPRRPMDTIATADPETKVIIFSNNTWEFYRPDMTRLDGEMAYQNNWDTTSIFSYRNVELADIAQVVELKIVDSMPQFCAPIVGRVISKYGPRRRRSHNGVDIPLRVGEPILASFDGKVRYAKYNSGGYGYLVIVRHPNGLETWHAHLTKLNVSVGDYVKTGQVIGFSGNTGRSRGPHLHFEVRYKDQSFDPEFIFDFESGQLRYTTFALERSYFNIHSRASELLEEDDYDISIPGSLLAEEVDDSTAVKATEAVKPKPATAKSTSGTTYHTIASGDMLGKLAIKYGVSVDQLCRLNNLTRTTTLRLGQKIRVR